MSKIKKIEENLEGLKAGTAVYKNIMDLDKQQRDKELKTMTKNESIDLAKEYAKSLDILCDEYIHLRKLMEELTEHYLMMLKATTTIEGRDN
jgi:hypothetical protein